MRPQLIIAALIALTGSSLAHAAENLQTLARRVAADAGSTNAPLLFCIGMHIEPFGATPTKLLGDAAPPPAQRPAGAPKGGGGVGGPGGRPGSNLMFSVDGGRTWRGNEAFGGNQSCD